MRHLLFSILAALAFGSCRDTSKPKILEKRPSQQHLNRVTVYIDSSFNDAKFLDTLSYTFQQPFILAPSPEPLYDLKVIDVSESNISSINYDKALITGIANQKSGIVHYLRNVLNIKDIKYNQKGWYLGEIKNHWVAPQSVYVAIAKDIPAYAKHASFYYDRMLSSLKKDNDILLSEELKHKNETLSKNLETDFGIQMPLPKDYIQAYKNDKGVWFRKDDEEKIYGLLVYKKPGLSTLKRIEGTALRNEAFLEILHQGDDQEDLVIAEDVNLPVYAKEITKDSLSALELRGVWKKTKGFAGGSFITHIINDTVNNQTILIDGFYFAPRDKKRDGISRLEYILSKAEIKK